MVRAELVTDYVEPLDAISATGIGAVTATEAVEIVYPPAVPLVGVDVVIPQDLSPEPQIATESQMHAADELFRTYWADLLRFAIGIVGVNEGEDIAQRALINTAYRKAGVLPQNQWSYLVTSVVNMAKSEYRTSKRRATAPGGDMISGWDGDTLSGRSQDAFSHLIDRISLVEAVSKLPDRQRKAVTFRYLLDMSEFQTAEAMGVSPGTVRSTLFRGIAALRASYGVTDQ